MRKYRLTYELKISCHVCVSPFFSVAICLCVRSLISLHSDSSSEGGKGKRTGERYEKGQRGEGGGSDYFSTSSFQHRTSSLTCDYFICSLIVERKLCQRIVQCFCKTPQNMRHRILQ